MDREGQNRRPAEELLHAAVERSLRDIGATVSTEGAYKVAQFQGDPESRFRFDVHFVHLEALESQRWVSVDERSYEEAWQLMHDRRVRRAKQVLYGVAMWICLGLVAAVWVWVREPKWLELLLRFLPLLSGVILWYRKIPFKEPYPELFMAMAVFGTSITIAHAQFPLGWGLAWGVAMLGFAFWGILSFGGASLIPYVKSRLSSDPRETAYAPELHTSPAKQAN